MLAKKIDVSEAEKNFQALLTQVHEGREILLVEGDTLLARIVPISPGMRIPGLHPGAITAGDDFDDPLPEEFWRGKA